jgi:hypothetical protein
VSHRLNAAGTEHAVTVTGLDEPIVASGDDAFEALAGVRRILERRGLLLAVQGARLHCVQSSMQRQSGGLVMYEVELGRPATEIRRTLDAAPPDDLATIKQQARFERRWLASLTGRWRGRRRDR